MLVYHGGNLVYDASLQRMVPYFPYVRSQDIVMMNPIVIEAALIPTSMRWELKRMEDRVDATVYQYIADWSNKNDKHGETVGSEVANGELWYSLYKDGRMELEGTMRLSPSTVESTAFGTMYNFQSYLPFGFLEEYPSIDIGWAFGSNTGLDLCGVIKRAQITNLEYNQTLDPMKTGMYLLEYYLINRSQTFNEMRKKVDPQYNSFDEANYIMTGKFPIRISYKGWWQPVKPADLAVPETHDDLYTATWRSTTEIALLSNPNITLAQVVRSLEKGNNLRCNGYYSKYLGKIYLLCTYVPTGEQGYVVIDSLERVT